jgi:hypothetical protein
MKKQWLSVWGFRGVAAASALSLMACASAAPPAESPPTAEASGEPGKAVPPQEPAEESAVADELSLAEGVAAQVAAGWATERAAKEKVELVVRIRVGDKSAVVVGKGDGAYTLTGKDAVNTKPDVTLDLTAEDAKAIAEGTTTMKALRAGGKLKSDNEQGLDWFLSYVDAPK